MIHCQTKLIANLLSDSNTLLIEGNSISKLTQCC